MKMNSRLCFSAAGTVFLLLSVLGACGPVDGGSSSGPAVRSTNPANGAISVRPSGLISAAFSEEMDPATINASTFTVASASGTPVAGAVVYANLTALFTPDAALASGASFTATITTGARSVAGAALGTNHVWSFGTTNVVTPAPVVNLGAAGGFAILAKSGISTVPNSVITGDVGVSPAAATFITGFDLSADATNVFSSATQVTGRLYAADYAPPTPSNLTTAVGDMELAFTDAAGRAPDVTELGAGNIGGMTLTAGVYKWGTGLLIPTNVILTGSATDVWIFQVAQDLTLSSGTRITLAGGVLPRNIFWQVSGAVRLGTTSHLEGVLLSQTAITLATGASANGRLLAQTAVDLDSSTVVAPAL